MDHASQWHYVPTRLMAHMGTYSPDEMNGLHCLLHESVALRIRAAMQRHNIWAIPGSRGYQGHASRHRRPRSLEVLEAPRQTARHDSPRHHQGPPPDVGSPPGTLGSPLRPFAPRRDRGSPHAPGMEGGTPDRHQEARNPDRSRHRCRTLPPAARRVVFHEDADRGRGGRNEPPARQTSSVADPRRRSKRPARCGRTSPAFQHRPSKRDRQCSTRASTRHQTVHPARLPPPFQSQRPVRCRGDRTPRTRGQGDPQQTSNPNRGWGDEPLKASPRKPGVRASAPDTGTGSTTNRTNAPRGSPPWL